MSEIFISYSRKDKDFVSKLTSDLEKTGWDVFWWETQKPDRKLQPGQNFEDVLSKEAGLAKYFLVVLSPDSLTSSWVPDELEAALRREREGRTKVVPLLFKPCEPQKLTRLIGKKYYADFTVDYKTGFEKLSSTLGQPKADVTVAHETSLEEPSPTLGEPKAGVKGGKPRRRFKETGIGVAVITGIVALVTAYWQFVYKPAHPDQTETIQYAGRVMDAGTQQVISRAKVSVDTQGVPQVYYSDSEGVFYLKLPRSLESARIRIEANGYETFDRNVSLSRTGIEDVRLVKNNSPANQNSSVGSRSKKPANNSKQDQINRLLSSEPSNRPN